MINLLPQSVINQIAAGEVVERPASVLKELIENSIDAKATEIKVFIEEFGTKKIQVIDNGTGISKSDFDKVFLKHTTSKISEIEDLDRLGSYGFRGEALASIASVSKIILETKYASDENGSVIFSENGAIDSIKPSAIAKGSNIQVLELFSNIPARKKFLKSKPTENKILVETFNKFALANPQINFTLNLDGVSKNYPTVSLQDRITKIFKLKEDELISISYDGVVKVSGFVVHPKVFLKNKSLQQIFVNKRIVTDTTIGKAAYDGYDTFLMKNQFPGYVIFVDIPPSQVDVNVHPRKTEVRFTNGGEVYKSVRLAVNMNLIRVLRNETREKLGINENNTKEESNNIETESVLNEKSNDNVRNVSYRVLEDENIESSSQLNLKSTNSLVTEFEAFLNNSSTNSKQLNKPPQKLNSFITEKAILFNKEIITEEVATNNLNLDFDNATQLLNSYILTSNGSSILTIDQHAASERFFYEKYLKSIKDKKLNSKLLLFPEIVSLNTHEVQVIENNNHLFEELGFEFENFGNEEIKFTKVPDFIKLDNFPKIIERIINDILENEEISNLKDKIFHETAAILACHTAVRFGDKLSKEEIVKILKNLSYCEDPYNCPHGRPIIQEMSRYDIEKKFKRCGM